MAAVANAKLWGIKPWGLVEGNSFWNAFLNIKSRSFIKCPACCRGQKKLLKLSLCFFFWKHSKERGWEFMAAVTNIWPWFSTSNAVSLGVVVCEASGLEESRVHRSIWWSDSEFSFHQTHAQTKSSVILSQTVIRKQLRWTKILRAQSYFSDYWVYSLCWALLFWG